MKSFYINQSTGDLELDGSNNLKMVDSDNELLQSVFMICSTNIDEWFLNPEHGFDMTAIQGKKVNYNVAIDALYRAILQDERIDSIEDINFNFDPETRKLNINFAFTKTTGELVEGGFTI